MLDNTEDSFMPGTKFYNTHLESTKEFCQLIAPISLSTFFKDYWERLPLYILRNRNGLEEIFRFKDFDNLISSFPLPTSSVRVLVDEQEAHQSTYSIQVTNKGSIISYIDPEKIAHFVKAGATIAIPNIDRYFSRLKLFSNSIRRALLCNVQINAYYTPRYAVGFSPHWDTHNVFILQIYGKKKWFVFSEPEFNLPLSRHTCDPRKLSLEREYEEFDLNQGNLIYIPRGFVHQAITTNEPSLHLTISAKATTWSEILCSLIEEIADINPELRESIPIFSADLNLTDLCSNQLRDKIFILLEQCDQKNKDLLNKFYQGFFSREQIVCSNFIQCVEDSESISEVTILGVNDNVKFDSSSKSSDVIVYSIGKTYHLDLLSSKVMSIFLQDKGTFTVSEISLRSGFSKETITAKLRELVSLGIIDIVSK